ncbi:MAG: GDSL-type esterase/lipase family protein [Planctomycetota bacterium]|nr:GDSL-type esterase/lipase family protein [Planctomycetota bacterium]
MTSPTPPPAEISAITPTPKIEDDFYDWHARHDAKTKLAAARKHDLVFIGDSITHLFEGDPALARRGERVWAERFAPRGALNLGFGWDRTQNVLWRLDHGEFAGQRPRLVSLLIGTNNLTGTAKAATNTPAQIVAGIEAIHRRLASASPDSRFLLMAILPRSVPADPIRDRIREANHLLKSYADRAGSNVTYLDLGPHFLAPDGQIPASLMDDKVHPTEAGYQIWAEAIEPIVKAALK